MKTGIGNIECLESWVQQLLFNAVDQLKMENWKKAAAADAGEGDSPFSLCMRARAGGYYRDPKDRQRVFGEASRSCARESRNPRDLSPFYKEENERLGKLLEELLHISSCI